MSNLKPYLIVAAISAFGLYQGTSCEGQPHPKPPISSDPCSLEDEGLYTEAEQIHYRVHKVVDYSD